jgi:hypothetical protein
MTRRTVILLAKATIPGGAMGDLFDATVQVKGHTRQGVYVAPHTAHRKKANTPAPAAAPPPAPPPGMARSKAPLTRMSPEAEEEWRKLMAQGSALRRRARELTAEVEATPSKSVRFKHKDGRFSLVGPDLTEKGKFRVTNFTADMTPWGHYVVNTLYDGLQEVLRGGAEPMPASERKAKQPADPTTSARDGGPLGTPEQVKRQRDRVAAERAQRDAQEAQDAREVAAEAAARRQAEDSEMGGKGRVPANVAKRVIEAVDFLHRVREQMDAKLRHGTELDATHVYKTNRDFIAQRMAVIDKFREVARRNGADPEAIIEDAGGIPTWAPTLHWEVEDRPAAPQAAPNLRDLYREAVHGAGAEPRRAARAKIDALLADTGMSMRDAFEKERLDMSAYFASRPIDQ